MGPRTRIVCVGNRLVPGDDLGPRVFDRLAAMALPPGVEAVDGGIAGLDLLGLCEGLERAVFVDRLRGFGHTGEIVVLDGLEAAAAMTPSYGHYGGLAYLLKALPVACEGQPPRVLVIGMEDDPDEDGVEMLARAGVALAAGSRPDAMGASGPQAEVMVRSEP